MRSKQKKSSLVTYFLRSVLQLFCLSRTGVGADAISLEAGANNYSKMSTPLRNSPQEIYIIGIDCKCRVTGQDFMKDILEVATFV